MERLIKLFNLSKSINTLTKALTLSAIVLSLGVTCKLLGINFSKPINDYAEITIEKYRNDVLAVNTAKLKLDVDSLSTLYTKLQIDIKNIELRTTKVESRVDSLETQANEITVSMQMIPTIEGYRSSGYCLN